MAPVMIGVILLDTRFRRFPGDIGLEESFTGPVAFERVPGIAAAHAVADNGAEAEAFATAGARLVARGATLITTSCGFLVLHQRSLAQRLAVPVATSALLLLPLVERVLPTGRRAGVLSFSRRHLTHAHLDAAGAAPDTAIAGLAENGVFQRAVLELPAPDGYAAREAEVIDAARALLASEPRIGAIVLECTNFSPHRHAVAQATGLPAFDIWSLLRMFGPQETAISGASRSQTPADETRRAATISARGE
jgi:hypothetical protein